MTKKEKEAQLAQAARQQYLLEEKQRRELGLREGYPVLLEFINQIRADLGLGPLSELPIGTRSKDPLKLALEDSDLEVLITPSLWRVFYKAGDTDFEDYLLPISARDFIRRLFKGEYPQFVDVTRS